LVISIVVMLLFSVTNQFVSMPIFFLYQQQQHPFSGPLSRTTQMNQCQKGKTNLDLMEQETVSGSGISWAICKSAPHPRQTTTPAPHHSVSTGWMPFLPPRQQRQSTEGIKISGYVYWTCSSAYSKM